MLVERSSRAYGHAVHRARVLLHVGQPVEPAPLAQVRVGEVDARRDGERPYRAPHAPGRAAPVEIGATPHRAGQAARLLPRDHHAVAAVRVAHAGDAVHQAPVPVRPVDPRPTRRVLPRRQPPQSRPRVVGNQHRGQVAVRGNAPAGMPRVELHGDAAPAHPVGRGVRAAHLRGGRLLVEQPHRAARDHEAAAGVHPRVRGQQRPARPVARLRGVRHPQHRKPGGAQVGQHQRPVRRHAPRALRGRAASTAQGREVRRAVRQLQLQVRRRPKRLCRAQHGGRQAPHASCSSPAPRSPPPSRWSAPC